MKSGEWSGELLLVGKKESLVTVNSRWTLVRDENEKPRSVLVIHTDISERKRVEEQFLRAQRMESIGTLAGGIAHDLNNVLSPIMMSIEVLRMKHFDEESRLWLRMLETSAGRGAALVKQILSFARGGGGQHVEFQAKHLLSELVKILKETLPKSIDIKFEFPTVLWPVFGEPTQLHQIFMNLCLNSRDALPHGGSITLKAEKEAIAIYAANKQEIEIIITDMIMPFMDGISTIRAIRRLKPDARIISTSGLSDKTKIAEATRAGVDRFLPKPYTAEQLLKALAEVLA
jgi:signal transduction histidine kinase